jgi:hypothetical protein
VIGARAYLTAIYREIARTRSGLTRYQRQSLNRVRRKWEARANNKDARFLVLGTIPGRVSSGDAELISEARAALAHGRVPSIIPDQNKIRKHWTE